MPIKQVKPIALIANSYISGLTYMRNKVGKTGIKQITNHVLELIDGQQVIIITSLSQVDGREFSGFWIHPEYEDELIASVMARVK